MKGTFLIFVDIEKGSTRVFRMDDDAIFNPETAILNVKEFDNITGVEFRHVGKTIVRHDADLQTVRRTLPSLTLHYGGETTP